MGVYWDSDVEVEVDSSLLLSQGGLAALLVLPLAVLFLPGCWGGCMSDDLKQAEQRGYSRGYATGRKRIKQDREAERLRHERQAFLDKAFLAALPVCINVSGWKFGEKPITNVGDRTKLAWEFATEALRQRR
jgi:hypothetical protein